MVNIGTPNEAWSVKVTRDATSLEIVKMFAKKNMYTEGLEKGNKNLVDMQEITDSLCTLLEGYINLQKLTYSAWQDITHIYRPFIDKVLNFDLIDQFLSDKTYHANWESPIWPVSKATQV